MHKIDSTLKAAALASISSNRGTKLKASADWFAPRRTHRSGVSLLIGTVSRLAEPAAGQLPSARPW